MDLKPNLPLLTEKAKRVVSTLSNLFIVNDKPFDEIITYGQQIIFFSLIAGFKRIEIICSTQYGKSLTVAIACIILTCIQRKKVVIVAPNADKAKIIMRYFIEHLGDDASFEQELEKNTRLERLRQEENKERITFRSGGSIFILSGNEKNSKKKIESAMGEGADVVIIDEGCLLSDDVEATIFRMIAGKGENAIYCKIGNPFYKLPPYSHFFNTWNNPNYLRIFIDSAIAIKEGRYNQEFLDEARTKPLAEVLYDCEFPDEAVMDSKGYYPLVISSDIKFGINKEILISIIKKDIEKGDVTYTLKLGCDIGGGGDSNVYVLRYGSFACILGENKSSDTMINISEIEKIMDEFGPLGLTWDNVNIDDIGIGRGVSDRLLELGHDICSVNVGVASRDKEFSNLKAYLYWQTRLWLKKESSRLNTSDKWNQLTWIRYKVNSDKQVKIESKADLKQRTGKSPDHAESLMLTFYDKPFIGII